MKTQPKEMETTRDASSMSLEDLQKELAGVDEELAEYGQKLSELKDQEAAMSGALYTGRIAGRPVDDASWRALLDRRNKLRQELGDLVSPVYAQQHPLLRRRAALLARIESIQSREHLIHSLGGIIEGLRG